MIIFALLTYKMPMSLFNLKDGKTVTIRHAKIDDAAALIEAKLQYLQDTKTIPLYVDEYPTAIKNEETLITRLTNERNSCLIVASYADQIIGNIDLSGGQRRKLNHTGVVGMAILESYRNLGLGTLLMNQLISWAESNEMLKILWLEVYDSNIGGKQLYAKTGFEECGRMKNFFNENGNLIDNIRMIKYLDK